MFETSRDLKTWSPYGASFVANEEPSIVEVPVEDMGTFFRTRIVP